MLKYYADWLKMISSDEIKEGMSIVGRWGKTHAAELAITIVGLMLLITSFAPTALNAAARNSFYLRATLCCYLLVWLVLFNRAAETPTYMLAATGMACWFRLDGVTRINIFVISIVLLVTYLFPSDLFPPFIHHFFREHRLKLYAYILFFCWLQYQFFYRLQATLRLAR